MLDYVFFREETMYLRYIWPYTNQEFGERLEEEKGVWVWLEKKRRGSCLVVNINV